MKIGSNTVSILATDISGSPVTSLDISGFVIEYSGIVTSPVASEVSNGVYNVAFTASAGQGYIKVTNPAVRYIYPEIINLDVVTYDSADTFNKLNVIGVSSLPASTPNQYSVINLTTKERVDLIKSIQVPSIYSLSGATSATVQCFLSSAATSVSAQPLSGYYSATVSNVSAGIIDIHIGDDVLTGLIPQNYSSTTILGDIRYIDAGGNEVCPVELNILVKRSYNSN
jgi:hypothetical protein